MSGGDLRVNPRCRYTPLTLPHRFLNRFNSHPRDPLSTRLPRNSGGPSIKSLFRCFTSPLPALASLSLSRVPPANSPARSLCVRCPSSQSYSVAEADHARAIRRYRFAAGSPAALSARCGVVCEIKTVGRVFTDSVRIFCHRNQRARGDGIAILTGSTVCDQDLVIGRR